MNTYTQKQTNSHLIREQNIYEGASNSTEPCSTKLLETISNTAWSLQKPKLTKLLHLYLIIYISLSIFTQQADTQQLREAHGQLGKKNNNAKKGKNNGKV